MSRVGWLRQYLWPKASAELCYQLVVRDIRARFRGSWLGLGWALLTPIAMLLVYTFVFRSVLKARWPGGDGSDAEFALQLFAGLVVYSWFSDAIGRAPGLVLEQVNLVKKVVFPLPLLAWVSVLGSGFFALLNLLVLIAGSALIQGQISGQLLWLPLIMLPLGVVLLGLIWLLSALGVYLRDLGQLVAIALPPLMFLSPVFYPVTALPVWVQDIMMFNPIALIIDSVRAVVLQGTPPPYTALAVYAAASVVVALVGAAVFQKTRKGFADVL